MSPDLPMWTSHLSVGLLALVFGMAFAENSIGLGLVLPGELLIAGLGVTSPDLKTTLFIGVAATTGAIAGDHVGYGIGRRSASRFRGSRVAARFGRDRLDRAEAAIARRAFLVVVGSKCLPGIRTLVPIVAGATKVRLRTFSMASLTGALLWSVWWVGAGAGLGASASRSGGSTAIAAVVTCAALALLVRRQLWRLSRVSARGATSSGDSA
jgi:membrane-associated protein